MNAQTKLLLVAAHHDSDMCSIRNILDMVTNKMLPSGISDVMYAYMVASDWVKWIKYPNSSEDSPLKGKTAEDVAVFLKSFQRITDDLAKVLQSHSSEVAQVFADLNPNLIQCWRSRDDLTRESTRMFHRSLRFTAQLFADNGDDYFNEILREKMVPEFS